jgi:soluble lytic murein transglycosylase
MSLLRALFAAVLLLCAMHGAFAEQLLSPSDRQAYGAAFAAAGAADWTAARSLAAAAHERLPAKVLLWLELMRDDAAPFADIVAFADANADWPRLATLRRHAEQLMDTVPDAEVRAYFAVHPPLTPKGKLRLAAVLAGAGQREALAALIRQMWVTPDLGPDDEQAVLDHYAGLLRPEDHALRLDRLLWAGQPSAARRELPRAPEDWQRLAEARLALAEGSSDAEAAVARVPERLRNDPGLILERVRWYRHNDRLEDAAQTLQQAPADLVRPAAWWGERDTLVRHLLDEHKDRLAYTLAAWRGLGETGAAAVEAEFLAGWIAFRRLDDPKSAAAHFTVLYNSATLPATAARGAYWLARTAEAMGRREEAHQWYTVAAAHGITYYGQLAAAHLGSAVHLDFPSEPQPLPQDVAEFDRSELVRAGRMLAEIGQNDLARAFVIEVAAAAKTTIDQKLVATFAESTGAFDVAITAAKRAGHDGVPLLAEGYPVIGFERRSAIEPPLVLAIARQESGFDVTAVSRADARGIMQLMPETARTVAKSLGMPFSAGRLTRDASYNLALGQGFLSRLLDRFAGSYVLAAAAYNAGPARVDQWLETLGDPRSGAVDPVDWVESIPYAETRNYVERVLENLQIYRLRLGAGTPAFTLTQDLRR